MQPQPQLLGPCPWTVHGLEGGLTCLPWLWSVGVGRSKPSPPIPQSLRGQLVLNMYEVMPATSFQLLPVYFQQL